MAIRYDAVKLGPPKRLDDGRLIAQATLTRTGIFVYRNPDGSLRREYRAPSEVGKLDSLNTLKLVPVTNNHPPVMVDSTNAKEYCVGQVGQDVTMAGGNVISTIVVNDASTIGEVESGLKQEVSCGYFCDHDDTPGTTPDGLQYDSRQLNIRYNHLAIVAAGRAGNARIRMDGVETDALYEIPGTAEGATPTRDHESKVTVDELTKALAKITELTTALESATKRADSAEALAKEIELKLTQTEADKAVESKRADAEKLRADSAEKAHKDATDGFDARVQERADLQAQAVEFLGRNDKGEVTAADGSVVDVRTLSAREIRCVVVEKLDGIKIDEKRSDDAVNYAYELATSRAKAAGEALKAARTTIVNGRTDESGSGDSEAKARAAATARLNNAWKTGSKESK